MGNKLNKYEVNKLLLEVLTAKTPYEKCLLLKNAKEEVRKIVLLLLKNRKPELN